MCFMVSNLTQLIRQCFVTVKSKIREAPQQQMTQQSKPARLSVNGVGTQDHGDHNSAVVDVMEGIFRCCCHVSVTAVQYKGLLQDAAVQQCAHTLPEVVSQSYHNFTDWV